MKIAPSLILVWILLSSSVSGLNLKASVELALKHNPSVIAAQKKSDAANARLGQAIGAFFPTLKVDGTYGKSYTQPSTVQFTTTTSTGATTQTLSFGTDTTATNRSLSASLNQPLFVAGLFPGYKIAQKSAEIAREDYNKSLLETSFNVSQAYYGVLQAEEMARLAEEAKEMAQSHLKKVSVMLSAGAATRADLLRAKVLAANSDVNLTKMKSGLDLAISAFNNVIGREIEQAVKLEPAAVGKPLVNLPEFKQLVSLALANRPDWKQYELTRQVGEENLRVAQSAYFPTAMLAGSTGNRYSDYQSYQSDVNSWTLTGAVSWTLFDGLGIQNRIREAAANLEAQRAAEEQVRNSIALEVREAFLNLKSAAESIDSAEEAVDSAEESYKVINSLFNSGSGTNLEVINAQLSLTQAKMNYYSSYYDLEIAKAKLNKVCGKELL